MCLWVLSLVYTLTRGSYLSKTLILPLAGLRVLYECYAHPVLRPGLKIWNLGGRLTTHQVGH
jgi:hypothetical protein